MYCIYRQKYGVNQVLQLNEMSLGAALPEGLHESPEFTMPEGRGWRKHVAWDEATKSLVRDHCTLKANAINEKTDEIIARGFTYKGMTFKTRLEDQSAANLRLTLLALGSDLSGNFVRAAGQTYYFTDNADFQAWHSAGTSYISGALYSGALRKDQVTAADNTAEAMAAILDDRG